MRARGRGSTTSLDQRYLDLVGIVLIGAGVYLGYVLYLGWDGGRVGSGASTALELTVGGASKLIPVALLGVGTCLVARPFITARAAMGAGAICITASMLLAFAAETGGLGAGGPERQGYFEPDYFREHGGALGEVLYWAATTLFQRIGAHILAVVLLVAGALLMTGSSVAGLLRSGARLAGRTGDSAREFATVISRTARLRERGEADSMLTRADPTEPLPTEGLGAEGLGSPEPGEAPDSGGSLGDGLDGSPPALSYDEAIERPAEQGDAPREALLEPEGTIEVARTPLGERRGEVTESQEIAYECPSPQLLREGGRSDSGPDARDLESVGRALLETLGHFRVDAEILGTVVGPAVSRYELRLAPGTKVSQITKLKDDLAYALASTEIRILAPIPGKQAIGVEVPNRRRRLVRLGDIYQGRPGGSSPLIAWLGKDIAGHAVWTDLARMPHVLVAGTTGSGKSGCINAVLSSILLHASPNDVRLVLVDPKRVELNHYETVPHLITPVVTAPRVAANVLQNLISEMEARYRIMGEARARSLVELNRSRRRAGEPPLPHVLCVIDELADLMMVAPAEVEDSIIRLAQKSRAVGIHLVLATQRPSTDVITGTIKVNIPARIAFAVASQVDSRVILDQNGAETLLGQGDMLFRPAGTSKLQRIQGALVTEEEIARIARHWSRQGSPDFADELLEARSDQEATDGELSPDRDELLDDAIRLVVSTQTASVSMLQRRLRVGYTRAGRLVDMLERRGVISGYEGSKPRQVLISEADLGRVLGHPHADSPPLETEQGERDLEAVAGSGSPEQPEAG